MSRLDARRARPSCVSCILSRTQESTIVGFQFGLELWAQPQVLPGHRPSKVLTQHQPTNA